MPRTSWIPIHRAVCWMVALGALVNTACQPGVAQFISERIVIALAPEAGERAILRYDPNTLVLLPPTLGGALEARGVEVELMPYGEVPDFDARLGVTDIYVWLPDPSGQGTTPAQHAALERWLDEGRGRQIHFHWGAGTMGADGMPGEHSASYDERYLDALAIDYQELDRHQETVIAALRSGPVNVSTPDGTDITFEIGDRPFNKQNGDASRERMALARTRIDREIELPAGVVRVAPLETSVHGTMVVPDARFPKGDVHGLTLQFERGLVRAISARHGEEIARDALARSPSLARFRELGIGFNPVLHPLPDEPWIPYYGYGEGVVRLSLGNNRELGGLVGGEGVRWFFFTNATVRVRQTVIVDAGKLVMLPHFGDFSLLDLRQD